MRASLFGIVAICLCALGATGCEVIANTDRNLIPGGGGGPSSSSAGGSSQGGGGAGTGGNLGGGGSGTGGNLGGGGMGGNLGGGGTGGNLGGMGGTGGNVGGGGAGGAGGNQGGGGAGPECVVPADCSPFANECLARTCIGGVCGQDFVPAGTATVTQTPHDCKQTQCDGAGSSSDEPHDGDLPDDNNVCTDDVCTNGVASNPNKMAGTVCGTNLVCDGNGTCTGCVMPSDCPGPDTECQTRKCVAGQCGFNYTVSGTPVSNQTSHDCKKDVCDGAGTVITVNDNTDLPVDNEQCTSDVCTSGVPSNPPVPSGSVCSENGGTLCNATGSCVQCLVATTCPGTDTECHSRTCIGGVCGISNQPAGTITPTQTPGDCKQNQCNASGGIVTVNLDTDTFNDGQQCTSDICTAGVPSNPPLMSGTACSQNGGTLCNGSGACVQCLVPTTCPGTDTDCHTRTCNAGVCGVNNLPNGTVAATQVTGDCKQNQCDGNGNTVSVNFNSDLPVDGQQCTGDVCTAGAPSNPPLAAGTACTQNGGVVCDGTGQCVPGCLLPTDCPGQDTECQTRTCTAGICGFNFAPVGTVTSAQTPGDCKQNQCNGSGTIVAVNLDTDVPADDLNQCTNEVCTAGVPSHPPTPIGSPCSQTGGTLCNGAGSCVQCNVGADCPSGVCSANVCQTPTCTDTVKNGSETGTDCGGGTCPACPAGQGCVMSLDCQSLVCTGLICQAPTCTDGVQNGTETGVDCGGSCPPCIMAVTNTSPANAATGVAVTPGTLTVTFNGAMNPSTLTLKTTLDAGACSGSIQVSTDDFATCVPFSSGTPTLTSGDTIASLTPAPGLAFGSIFKLRVTAAAQGALGQPTTPFTMTTGFLTRTDAASSVVISQVYGGGGNAGAPYLNDFIELHNRSSLPVNIGGWSVQYASQIGTTWTVTGLSGTIAPGGYYLVQEASNGAVGVALPTPDATGTTNLSAAMGKVALVTNTVALAGACPLGAPEVDLVGYGTANCSETATVGAPSNTTAAVRRETSCHDTDSNALDMTLAAPTPKNSATAPQTCPGTSRNETGTGEVGFCNVQFPLSLSLAPGAPSGDVFGRVFEAGTTEGAGDSGAFVVQLGYGPRTVNPEWQSGWTWVSATYNVQVGNDDEYKASFTAPAAGSYAYAYRFSMDNGVTWTYCDDVGGAGSNAGLSFETPPLDVMTVL